MKNSKCTTVGKVFTIAAALTLALVIAPTVQASDKGCSNFTLRGTYAQTGTGVITAPPDQAGPFANVGTLVFDGNGGLTGALVVSSNGSSCPSDRNRNLYGEFRLHRNLHGPDCSFWYHIASFLRHRYQRGRIGNHRDRPGLRNHLRREEAVSRKSHLKA